MTVDTLPRLRIVSISPDDCSIVGKWDTARWIGENHIACIVVDNSQFIWGRLSEVDDSAQTCRFTTDNADDLAVVEVGEAYPRLDGYWGDMAELVLDRSKHWRERRYDPPDAVWFEKSRTLKRFDDKVPPGGKLVPGGWDHEHCNICWETISLETNQVGIFAEPDHWLCRECYRRFVLPQSLDFIIDNH